MRSIYNENGHQRFVLRLLHTYEGQSNAHNADGLAGAASRGRDMFEVVLGPQLQLVALLDAAKVDARSVPSDMVDILCTHGNRSFSRNVKRVMTVFCDHNACWLVVDEDFGGDGAVMRLHSLQSVT